MKTLLNKEHKPI